MESMDFTDMFKHTSDGVAAKKAPTKTSLVQKNAAEDDTFNSQNTPPTSQHSADSDSLAHVQNMLRNMNHDVKSSDLAPSVLKVIEALFAERNYYEQQAASVTDESMKVRSSLAQAQRDKVRDSDTIESLKRVRAHIDRLCSSPIEVTHTCCTCSFTGDSTSAHADFCPDARATRSEKLMVGGEKRSADAHLPGTSAKHPGLRLAQENREGFREVAEPAGQDRQGRQQGPS